MDSFLYYRDNNDTVANVCTRIYGANISSSALPHDVLSTLSTSYFILAAITAVLSIGGAVTIIWTIFSIPALQTKGRVFLVYLSFSDLIVATGNLTGIIWTLTVTGGHTQKSSSMFHAPDENSPERDVCAVQAAITSTASLMSFSWTSFIALNIYLTVVRQNNSLTTKLRLLPHVISWGVPIMIGIVTLSYKRYGLNICTEILWWCWIRPRSYDTSSTNLILWQLLTGKLWEIISYIAVLIIYGVVVFDISSYVKRLRKHNETAASETGGHTPLQRSASSALVYANKKLIFVPLVFIIARVWGTLRFLLDLIPSSGAKEAAACLAPLQGFGDSAQGFLNCAVFIFTTPSIRDKLPCRRLKIMFRSSQSGLPEEPDEMSSSTSKSLTISQTTRMTSDRHRAPRDYGATCDSGLTICTNNNTTSDVRVKEQKEQTVCFKPDAVHGAPDDLTIADVH